MLFKPCNYFIIKFKCAGTSPDIHENLKNRSAKLLDVYWDKIANRKQYETPHL